MKTFHEFWIQLFLFSAKNFPKYLRIAATNGMYFTSD
jgi:hypothetical protein